MANIKITESELRHLIRESVSEVLSERINYGTEWETLSEPEKRAAAEKYYKNSAFHPSMGSITYTYPDGTTGTSAYKYDQATGQQIQGTANYNMDAAKDIYNRKRDRKQRNGNLSYSADQFNQAQKNSEEQINALKAQLATANKTATMYRNAIGAVSKALNLSEGMIKENISPDIEGAPQSGVPSTQKQPVGQEGTPVGKAPELDAILGAIKKLNGTIGTQKASITNLTNQLNQAKQSLATRTQNSQNAIRTPANNNLQRPGLTTQNTQLSGRPNQAPGTTPGTQLA